MTDKNETIGVMPDRRSTQLQLRLSPQLKLKLQRIADKNNTSLSVVVLRAIGQVYPETRKDIGGFFE